MEPSVFNSPRGIKTVDRRGVRQFPFIEKLGNVPSVPIFPVALQGSCARPKLVSELRASTTGRMIFINAIYGRLATIVPRREKIS